MELLNRILQWIWSMIQSLFAPILGPFTRAISTRRVDDGSGP